MINLKEYKTQIQSFKKSKLKLEKQLKDINKKLFDYQSKHKYICKKCGLVFSKNELGYRKYFNRWINTQSQPMGDYDQTQYEYIEHILCCPKCGKSFKEVLRRDYVWSSQTVGRYDDNKGNFKYPLTCTKLLSKEIFKQ